MINLKRIPVILITLILGVTLLVGCGNKTAIVKNDFGDKMKENGFQIKDLTDQAEKGKLESITVATNDNYQIEFYEMNNEDDAINAYGINKSKIENKKGSLSSNSSIEMGNYGKYKLSTNEKYYCISRIGKTFIYVEAPSDYKDSIEKYLDKLGY